jgi:hypothetical protein
VSRNVIAVRVRHITDPTLSMSPSNIIVYKYRLNSSVSRRFFPPNPNDGPYLPLMSLNAVSLLGVYPAMMRGALQSTFLSFNPGISACFSSGLRVCGGPLSMTKAQYMNYASILSLNRESTPH